MYQDLRILHWIGRCWKNISSLDCGVFLMSYMFSLVSGQAISIDQKDCARHRARIVSLFLSEGYKQSPQAHFLGC
ncbi:uncharacterized protein LOC109845134 isoform X2 [Asparagus officinalis]|uniref:uncharacterized protein LOC109845134 isoform X2 n=1 Tax=Asparagus officinalis TaxID=4686 RepID=UPI00098DE551|nr:uncharacterized protein LOC109845134 isoform X2 [Asparagus officinalis]